MALDDESEASAKTKVMTGRSDLFTVFSPWCDWRYCWKRYVAVRACTRQVFGKGACRHAICVLIALTIDTGG